jgi:DNA-binding NarL/FixJ family response regulator
MEAAAAQFTTLGMKPWMVSMALRSWPAEPVAAPDGLTGREVEVPRLIAAGHTSKHIAAQLSLSVATVQRHVANIYAKIDARGRADATAYALRSGLVPIRIDRLT